VNATAVAALLGVPVGWLLGRLVIAVIARRRTRRARRALAALVVAEAEAWCRWSAAFAEQWPAMPRDWSLARFLRTIEHHPATQARKETP